MKGLAYNPTAISEEAIDIFANHAKEPGGLRPQLEHVQPAVDISYKNQNIQFSHSTSGYSGDVSCWVAITQKLCFRFNASISHKRNWHNSSIFGTLDSRRATTVRH